MIIYLGSVSPRTSCGTTANRASSPPLAGHDWRTLQRTGFTSRTSHLDWLWALTPLVSPLPSLRTAVSFLWHFPYGRPRLPLATVLLYAVRTFLTSLAAGAIIIMV
jgi:hypothetical protein